MTDLAPLPHTTDSLLEELAMLLCAVPFRLKAATDHLDLLLDHIERHNPTLNIQDLCITFYDTETPAPLLLQVMHVLSQDSCSSPDDEPQIPDLEAQLVLFARHLLERGYHPDVTRKSHGIHSRRPLSLAAEKGHLLFIDLLLEYHANPYLLDEREESALSRSLQCDNPASFAKLVDLGAHNVFYINESRKNYLHRVSSLGYCLDSLLPNAQKLLDLGVNPLARDNEGYTPLHFAAGRQQLDLIQLLLSQNPCAFDEKNINARTRTGMTPLHLAVHHFGRYEGSLESHQKLLLLLIEHGADIETVNESGNSLWDTIKDKSLPTEGFLREILQAKIDQQALEMAVSPTLEQNVGLDGNALSANAKRLKTL